MKSLYRKLGVSSRAEAVAQHHLGEIARDAPLDRGARLRAMTYEFVLRGEIGDRFGPLFEGMRLERGDGRTVLTAPVRDQSELHGVIERIQELGLELISVNPSPKERA